MAKSKITIAPSSLEILMQQISQNYWPGAADEFITYQTLYVLTEKEEKWLIQQSQYWMLKFQEGRATNPIYAGLMLGGSSFLAQLKKSGLLRISRYDFQDRPVVGVVTALLKPNLGLSADAICYLLSVAMLHRIGACIRKRYNALVDWMRTEKEVGLKSLVATLDTVFMVRELKGLKSDKENFTSADDSFFDLEDLASGCSTILAIYSKTIGPPLKNPAINKSRAEQGYYVGILKDAAHIAEFREWESLVDRFDYLVQHEQKNQVYRIQPPSIELERAIRLGFMQSQLQWLVKSEEWYDKDVPWLNEMAKEFAEATGDLCAKVVKTPVERYVFSIPMIDELLSFLMQDSFFQEEQLALRLASRNLLTPVDKILDEKLESDVTIRDLVRVSRLIQFMRWVAAYHLLPLVETRTSLVLQSIVPQYTRGELSRIFSYAVEPLKAERIIELLLIDFSELGHIDIQYQSLIACDSVVWLPMNVFACSNILRNFFALTRKRLYSDGKNDPLPRDLASLLRRRGYITKEGVQYSYGDNRGDVDVMVLIDNILFVLECKNSLLPASSHELITSFDYVKKGADQLDRFSHAFQDLVFRNRFAKQTGIHIDSQTRLVTGIVMSNRMLMGYRLRGHAVRGNYELEQFVRAGTVFMGEEVKRFWQGEAMTGEDFRRYLQDDITYQPLWDSMVPYTMRYELDECKVEIVGLNMDMLSLSQAFGFPKAEASIRDALGQ